MYNMRSLVALALLAGSQAVIGSPVEKRQATSTLVPTEITSAASSAVESAASSAAAPASAVSSATSSESAAAASASASMAPTYPFSCPDSYLLTYLERQENFDSALDAVTSFAGDWSTATYLGEVANNGMNNTVGAERTVVFPIGVAVNETLTNYTLNPVTSAVIQSWNSTGGLSVMNLTVGNYSAEQQIYTNDTANATTVKYFVNFCTNDQVAGIGFLNDYATAVFNNISMALGNTGISSASSSAVMPSSAVPSTATDVPASVTSIALESGLSTASGTFSAASAAPSGSLMINTPPSLIECQPRALVFSGGQAPYYLTVLPGGQTSATPLRQFPVQQSPGAFTWNVDLPSGTTVTIAVTDGSGNINYSAQVTVQAGTSTACIPSS